MFEWCEKYSVKIDFVDEEHKQLFIIGQKVEALLKTPNVNRYNEIVILLEKLTDYTQYHFSSEEWLMNKYYYPGVEDHMQAHHEFVEYIESFDMASIKESQEDIIKELLGFIDNWIIEHIRKVDSKYSEFIVNAIKSEE